jgi:hypothetical protein
MSAPSWSFRTYFLPVLALAVAAACSDRQAPAGPDDAGLQPGFKGKPGGGDIVVGTFNPTEGAQGESFLMTVSGSGFGKGAKVVFVLSDEDVSTISTTTKSIDETGTNLTADVDIGLDAEDSEDYLVAVTLRGRRGIGAENFKVKVKPNEALGWPIKVTFNDQTPNRLQSDGQPYEYGAVYTEHIDAWIWPGGTEPGYLKMDRRGFGTVSDPVLSTREFELHFDGLGLDLRDGFCDRAGCGGTLMARCSRTGFWIYPCRLTRTLIPRIPLWVGSTPLPREWRPHGGAIQANIGAKPASGLASIAVVRFPIWFLIRN